MKIALDVMGGDNAPSAIIAGAVEAYQNKVDDQDIVLVGDQVAIKAELEKYPQLDESAFEIRHASQSIGMHESPVTALRSKKDSSIARCVEMVKKGEADAVVSAGNTGAVVAASQIKLRTLPGIERAAIATVMPSQYGPFLLLDVGANSDCRPYHLCQYAVMGSIYAQSILDKQTPKVGLLSIGEEDSKGNDLTKEAFEMISSQDINFIGNVEGKDFFTDKVDVIVADGFVGNVALKACEALASAMRKLIKDELLSSFRGKLGGLLAKPAFLNVKKKTDYAEYGGAPLLGVNGTVIISHGSSNAKAINNAIKVAYQSFTNKVNEHIIEEFSKNK